MHKVTVLPNKVKVVTYEMPHVHGVSVGFFVGTGSRFEDRNNAGAAHFLEHMFFKGTKNRPNQMEIAKSIEGIGGYLNAYTSQDNTCYYNCVPSNYAEVSFEIIADMLNNSLLDQEAIEREKGVITEELNMYLDTPGQYIYDLIMEAIWGDQPLGRPIIGNKKSIAGFSREILLDFINTQYRRANSSLCVAGRIKHERTVALAKKYFQRWPAEGKQKFSRAATVRNGQSVLIHYKKTDQAHLCLAVPGLPYNHQDEIALVLLDAIMGSGMSSRLFLKIREEKGLCYNIHSFTENFVDGGLFGVAAGLNKEKIELAIEAVKEEMMLFTKEKVNEEEIIKAKEYISGNLRLQSDSSDNMIKWYGNMSLFYPHLETPEQKIKKLWQVKENDIMKIAKKILRKEKMRLVMIGPFEKKEIKKFAKLLK